jgi:two-component system chemotaxis response regulator CheB
MISTALAADPQIEVVGSAVDPYDARDKIKALSPDVLTLDIDMPRMDGLTFLKILQQQHPMPVIMVSSLTQEGSAAAIESLENGAFEVLAKPTGPFGVGHLGPQLIACVKAAAASPARARTAPPSAAPTPPAPKTVPAKPTNGTHSPFAITSSPTATVAATLGIKPVSPTGIPATRGLSAWNPRQVILIGSSTGGVEALAEIFPRLPASLPGIAIVQHIPAYFS